MRVFAYYIRLGKMFDVLLRFDLIFDENDENSCGSLWELLVLLLLFVRSTVWYFMDNDLNFLLLYDFFDELTLRLGIDGKGLYIMYKVSKRWV
jgi:hypothetical protein